MTLPGDGWGISLSEGGVNASANCDVSSKGKKGCEEANWRKVRMVAATIGDEQKIHRGNRVYCRSVDDQAGSSSEPPSTSRPIKNPREPSALSLAGLDQRRYLAPGAGCRALPAARGKCPVVFARLEPTLIEQAAFSGSRSRVRKLRKPGFPAPSKSLYIIL